MLSELNKLFKLILTKDFYTVYELDKNANFRRKIQMALGGFFI